MSRARARLRGFAFTLEFAFAFACVACAACAAALPATAAELVFEADMREAIASGRFVPGRDTLGLRGGFAPLSWQRSLALQPAGDGRWRATVHFERSPYGGQAVQHKFRIEAPDGGADDGWEPGRNHLAWVAAPGRVSRVFGAEAPMPPRHWAGEMVELGPVASRHVPPRPVRVWLPPGYERDTGRRYPVLYLHDGQNMFDAEAAGAEWQVDEAAQAGVMAGRLEPMIIVAVPSGADRVSELTPTRDARAGGGGLAAYGRFIADELKPEIDRRFRTRPGRDATAVGGSSLGGIASLALALQPGSVFGAALVVSPSLWWDGGWAERSVRALQPADAPLARPRLWLDMGGGEGAGVLPALRRLCDALRGQGWQSGELACTEDPDGGHDESSWAARVPAMLAFLYGRGRERR